MSCAVVLVRSNGSYGPVWGSSWLVWGPNAGDTNLCGRAGCSKDLRPKQGHPPEWGPWCLRKQKKSSCGGWGTHIPVCREGWCPSHGNTAGFWPEFGKSGARLPKIGTALIPERDFRNAACATTSEAMDHEPRRPRSWPPPLPSRRRAHRGGASFSRGGTPTPTLRGRAPSQRRGAHLARHGRMGGTPAHHFVCLLPSQHTLVRVAPRMCSDLQPTSRSRAKDRIWRMSGFPRCSAKFGTI